VTSLDKRSRRRIWALAAIVAIAAALVAAALVGRQLADRRYGGVAASPSPTAASTETARVNPSATASATTSPAGGLGTHVNRMLGYRIALPDGYRRSDCLSFVLPEQELMGVDAFTLLSDREERALTTGDIPSREYASNFHILVQRNVERRSPVEWARDRPENAGATVVPATFAGGEAARVVSGDAIRAVSYVIRADDRIYVLAGDISGGGAVPERTLTEVAASFRPVLAGPFPTAPPQATREAARELGKALADAFVARNADALAGLIGPRCQIGVHSTIASPQGTEGCCILNRAVAPFIEALRERFARGELTVMVGPEVQVRVEGGREALFVTSNWMESGRTRQIDLLFNERAGRWYWEGALHHYQRTELPVCYSKLWSGSDQPC
jgi:hypothetical protein